MGRPPVLDFQLSNFTARITPKATEELFWGNPVVRGPLKFQSFVRHRLRYCPLSCRISHCRTELRNRRYVENNGGVGGVVIARARGCIHIELCAARLFLRRETTVSRVDVPRYVHCHHGPMFDRLHEVGHLSVKGWGGGGGGRPVRFTKRRLG